MIPSSSVELDPASRRTVPALLQRNAQSEGHRPFLVDRDGSVSYLEISHIADRVASGLQDLGIGTGDRVAIMMDNRREFIYTWFGLATLGAVEVPVNQQSLGARLIHVLNHSGCIALVVDAKYLPQVEAVRDSLISLRTVVVLDGSAASSFKTHSWDTVIAAEPLSARRTVRLSDPATVMYTSGSTGPAKGALLSHGHHYMNGFQAVKVCSVTSDDRFYLVSPLHHNMAQGYAVMPALVAGASVYLGEPFERRRFWDDVSLSRATVFPFVGAMLVLLLKNDPSSAEREHRIRVGYGVPIPAPVHRPFEERFGFELVHCYGSTEATIPVWNTGDNPPPGAAGLPLPGYEVRLVDDEDLPVPQGDVGQVCVRSVEPWSMFSGYLNDPERTVTAWRNGWFHTGDRGRFDEEGRLWFADRLGDVIRCKGESVSAFEIEDVVVGHPEVSLVAAFGVPNSLGDEDIVTSVVLVDGSSLTPTQLFDWCVPRLPRYALPRYVQVTDSFPMTPTGKVEKFRLRDSGLLPDAFDVRAIPPAQTDV